jgi:hypothetical protein
MKNIWRGLCVAIFIFGAVSVFQAHKRAAGVEVTNQSIDVSDTESAQAFVVEYVDSNVSSGGTVTLTGSSTRQVKANGEWRLVIRRNNGQMASTEGSNEVATYGGTPDGVYETKNDSATRRYVSPSSVSPSSDQTILQLYRSHNYLRAHSEFVRKDRVAGLDVYVLRTEVANSPGQWIEKAYSPRTGLAALRTVIHMSDGSEVRREAVSVVFNEIPENLNEDLENLPITPGKKKIQ